MRFPLCCLWTDGGRVRDNSPSSWRAYHTLVIYSTEFLPWLLFRCHCHLNIQLKRRLYPNCFCENSLQYSFCMVLRQVYNNLMSAFLGFCWSSIMMIWIYCIIVLEFCCPNSTNKQQHDWSFVWNVQRDLSAVVKNSFI